MKLKGSRVYYIFDARQWCPNSIENFPSLLYKTPEIGPRGVATVPVLQNARTCLRKNVKK